MNAHDEGTVDTTGDDLAADEPVATLDDLLADEDDEPTGEDTGDESTGDEPGDEDTVADALRRLLPDPGVPCPDDLTRDDLWAAVKELRRENARRREQARTAKAAAASGVTPEGMTSARAEAMAEAGLVVEHAVLRAEANRRGATGKQAEAVAVLASGSIAREGLDPSAADYLVQLGAAAEAAVAQVVDDLPTLAGAAEAVPPISQGVRGSGLAAPPSADAWLRDTIAGARRT